MSFGYVWFGGFDPKTKRELSALLAAAGGHISYMMGKATTIVLGPQIQPSEESSARATCASILTEAEFRARAAAPVSPQHTDTRTSPLRSRLDTTKRTAPAASPVAPTDYSSLATTSYRSEREDTRSPAIGSIVPETIPAASSLPVRIGLFGTGLGPTPIVYCGPEKHLATSFSLRVEISSPSALLVEVPVSVLHSLSSTGSNSIFFSVRTSFGTTFIEAPLQNSSASSGKPGTGTGGKKGILATDSDSELRVFISSPFKDMQEERDIFARYCAPRLRRLCESRGVVFSFTDLRWGVTASQSEAATGVILCLRELARSSVMIGFLGSRYGWWDKGEGSEADLLMHKSLSVASRQFPFVESLSGCSLTEIEMKMVLEGHRDMPAWFYLRDENYANTVSALDRKNFQCEGMAEAKKMEELRTAIRNSGFPCYEGYTDPRKACEEVYKALSSWIEARFPANPPKNRLEELATPHRKFAAVQQRSFLPRGEYFHALDKFVCSDTEKPLVIAGTSGVGKSALLANWVKEYRAHKPEDLVVEHYVGSSSQSTNSVSILKRILGEISQWLEWKDTPIPEGMEELVPEVTVLLEKASSEIHGRIILVLDGLEKLEDDESNALDLLWLPQRFPAKVKIILSTTEGRPLEACNRRNWPTLELKPLMGWEIVSYSRQFLQRSSKRLSETQEFALAETPAASSPLWTRVFLDELTVFGEFDRLESHISQLLSLCTIEELYESALDRLSHDNQASEPFFTALWASKRGLLQSDLEAILARRGLSSSDIESIILLSDDLLFNCGGLIALANSSLSAAVSRRFCASQSAQQFAHETLANYFASVIASTPLAESMLDQRVCTELCWQLEACSGWSRLREFLMDIRVFLALFSTGEGKYQLMHWWRVLGSLDRDPVDVPSSISKMIDSYLMDTSARFGAEGISYEPISKAALFLEEMASYEASEKLYNLALSHCPPTNSKAKNDLVGSLARLYERESRYEDAEGLLFTLLKETSPSCSEAELSRIHNRLGAILVKTNKLDESEHYLSSALKLREKAFGEKHSRVGQTLKHMVALYEAKSDFRKAEQCGLKALQITEESLGPTSYHVSTILLKLGSLYTTMKESWKGKKVLERALDLRSDKYGLNHPLTAEVLRALASVLMDAGEYNKAEEHLLSALDTMKQAHGPKHSEVARMQLRLGELYVKMNRNSDAEALLQACLKTRKELYGPSHSRVGQVYKHLINLYCAEGRMDECRAAAREALSLTQGSFGKQNHHVKDIMERMNAAGISL